MNLDAEQKTERGCMLFFASVPMIGWAISIFIFLMLLIGISNRAEGWGRLKATGLLLMYGLTWLLLPVAILFILQEQLTGAARPDEPTFAIFLGIIHLGIHGFFFPRFEKYFTKM